jgi:ADP-dependent NAD(P)H-hydrate dehydratase / NAD(P)H-hydrate epimerase
MTAAKATALSPKLILKTLPRRQAESHKGHNGHVLLVAGSRGMSGAAVLSARGALRIGAGLVTVAIVDSERSVVTHQLPEALTLPLPENNEGHLTDAAMPLLRTYMQKRPINALAIGPGLSIADPVERLVKAFLSESEKPLVLDADGLNTISLDDLSVRSPLIITPHPGELAKLLRIEAHAVQRYRVQLAQNLARQRRLICVLKGHQTVIADGKVARINSSGNPAMATGGMGDVLTGAIAGLLAQGLSPWDAACAGVYLHGLAGDLAKVSDRGLLASEVADFLPRALSKIGLK